MAEHTIASDLDENSLSTSPEPQLPGSVDLKEESQTEPSPEIEVKVTEEEKLQLIQLRLHWLQLLQEPPCDGDAYYVIPNDYLTLVLQLQAPTLTALSKEVGKVTCSSIVDGNGNMYPVGEEPVASAFVSPRLFEALVANFGIAGPPVVRNLLVDAEGITLERFPPFFVVHTLTKATSAPKSNDRSALHSRCAFLLSQTSTFKDLHDTVQGYMFKATKVLKFRLWFITTDNIEDLPAIIPVSVFLSKITYKKVVGPAVAEETLQSQGIRSLRLHIVVEIVDKTTKVFPVDLVLAASQLNTLDYETIITSGGNLGLSNLGNTCYMNSALQCLVHLPEVNYYFFFNLFERELNRTNPLGNKGEVAMAFSNLLHKLFDSNTGGLSYVTPRDFKYTIGRYSSMFHGYQQQDSQEFLSWLLDALHEDLNRIHDKPYCEKPELKDEDVDNPHAIVELAEICWDQHKKRNDSIIVDLFTGMYQSTLVCPTCSKKSVTFDPFNDLTLPLPVNKKWYCVLTIVDLSGAPGRDPILKLEVELNKSSNYDDLIAYLSNFLNVPSEYLFLFEIFRNFIYKNFQENTNRHKFLPVSELISDTDTVVAYIIPHSPASAIIIPLVNTIQDEDKSYNLAEPFAIPLFVVLNSEEACSFGTIRRKTEQTVKILTRIDMETKYKEIKGEQTKTFFRAEDFPLIKRYASLQEDTEMIDSNTATIVEEDLDDEYDSDISFAHPIVGAAFGYEIKYVEDNINKHALIRPTGKHVRYNSEPDEHTSSALHVPHRRPQFSHALPLASKLPETKRNYYHYPDFVAQVQAEEKERDGAGSDDEGLGYVLVDPKEKDIEPTPINTDAQQLDEDTDSDTNWDNVSPLFASVDQLKPPGAPTRDSDRDASEAQSPNDPVDDKNDKHLQLVDGKTTLICEWDELVFDQFFKDPEHQAWENPTVIPNPELEENKRKLALQQKSTVSLYDCLRNFSTPEVLGDQDLWYCPNCKDHKRATKTIQVWSTGDILTIHLKRFQSARSFSDKINMVVDFPIEGLDMSEFAASLMPDKPLIYDLVAVDNHYGGLGGGHYTGCAKNFRDQKWYYFNDGRVTAIEDPKECITGAAYLLFYKKRNDQQFVGGNAVELLLAEGRADFELKVANLREQLLQVLEQVDLYNLEELMIKQRVDEAKKTGIANEEVESDDDLYGDSDSKSTPIPVSSKKLRSPVSEAAMKFEFENQRKQRLISKDSDLPRSVNINMGYSSSVSNLASPTGSSSEDSPE